MNEPPTTLIPLLTLKKKNTIIPEYKAHAETENKHDHVHVNRRMILGNTVVAGFIRGAGGVSTTARPLKKN